jgi:hypothetical protein
MLIITILFSPSGITFSVNPKASVSGAFLFKPTPRLHFNETRLDNNRTKMYIRYTVPYKQVRFHINNYDP